MATKSRVAVRRAGPISRLRARLADSLYRGQLGPSREAELQTFSPNRTWHNHRAL
jgi:hypothetical protein